MHYSIKTVTSALAAAGCLSTLAAPVTIVQPFMNLENVAVNSIGLAPGQNLRIGANSVTALGHPGTTGIGTSTRAGTGTALSVSLVHSPGPLIPNFYVRSLRSEPALFNPWTLSFSNGGDTSRVTVSLPAGATQAPFVNSITLSGTSANPTFSWTPPPGTTVNGYRVNIYDRNLINRDPFAGPLNNGQVTSRNLGPGVTSYTVEAADFTVPGNGFLFDHDYSIEIGLLQTKDGGSANLSNANLQAISRVYADFRATAIGSAAVQLPVTLLDGAYQFDFAVTAGETYYIDPEVAIGYDYRIGGGDPNFASVVLPTGIGDGRYDIFGFDASRSNAPLLLAHDWLGGSSFDFGVLGIDAFRVTGIEPSAGLDPANTTAFVTGLTFIGNGRFTGTQTPITIDVAAAVPEPDSAALMLLGLAAICIVSARRRAVADRSRARMRPARGPACMEVAHPMI